MLNWPGPDVQLRQEKGDATVEPDVAGMYPSEVNNPTQFPYPLGVAAQQHHQLEVTYLPALLTATGQAIRTDYRPQYWYVANGSVANTELLVYMSDVQSGVPIRLGPGGTVKIPGRGTGNSIYVFNNGSASAKVNVIALSGDQEWLAFSLSPG